MWDHMLSNARNPLRCIGIRLALIVQKFSQMANNVFGHPWTSQISDDVINSTFYIFLDLAHSVICVVQLWMNLIVLS